MTLPNPVSVDLPKELNCSQTIPDQFQIWSFITPGFGALQPCSHDPVPPASAASVRSPESCWGETQLQPAAEEKVVKGDL